jgi:uncharacterized membrane protein YjjB (DUF3815 family)
VVSGAAIVGESLVGVVSGGSVVAGSSLESATAVAGAAVGVLSDVVSSLSLPHAVAARRQSAAIAPLARVALFMMRSLLWSEQCSG